MIQLGLNDAAPSMRLARPVLSRDGRVLLGQGAELTAAYVERLRGFDVRRLWVRDDRLRDIEASETYSHKTRNQIADRFQTLSLALLKDPTALKGIMAGGVFDLLVSEAMEARHQTVPAPDESAQEDALVGHSVRVCLLATSLGVMLRYTPEQVRNLAVGALIHDIGHVLRKNAVPAPPQQVDADSPEHAHLGFEAVLRARHLSATISVVCLQHHERLDGNGWPRRLAGSSIHPFARLTAVADRYDTLVWGRDAVLPHLAKQQIAEDGGTGLDADLVKMFVERIVPYPAGTPLRLSNGHQAVVTGTQGPNPDRPLVRILPDDSAAFDLDLSAETDLEIESVRWTAPIQDTSTSN
jgi:HD-GYP domain-containing protein (c-di-GMP phosphodiesterase class II)